MRFSDAARRNRARLSHVLGAAELISLEEPVVDTTPHRNKAPKVSEAEKTSVEAARLLHVSRTHLNTLIEEGKIGGVRRIQEGHRRLRLSAVLEYKEETKVLQKTALNKTIAASQRIGLYDAELEGLPVRKQR